MTSANYIRTGAMRHRARLERKVQTADDGGGQATTWELDREVWCQIRPLSGSMRLAGMQRQSEISHEIYFRYAADIDTTKRVVYAGKSYMLAAVWSPEGLPEFLHAAAVEGVET